jgi:hypothetical protein
MTDKGMLVLQDCMDIEKCVPGPRSETYPTSSHDANQAMNIKVEEDSHIKEEEDPVPVSCEAIKAELEVSCVSVCPLLCREFWLSLFIESFAFPYAIRKYKI